MFVSNENYYYTKVRKEGFNIWICFCSPSRGEYFCLVIDTIWNNLFFFNGDFDYCLFDYCLFSGPLIQLTDEEDIATAKQLIQNNLFSVTKYETKITKFLDN